jgi:hypothetical protein
MDFWGTRMGGKSQIAVVAFVATLASSASAYSKADIAGRYERTRPSKSDLTVTRSGDQWKITLKGAGDPSSAGAAAADCEMEAVGKLKGDVLTAKVVPFEGDDITVSADQLKDGNHLFIVKFDNRGARLTTQDVSFCGLGSDLLGRYSRRR